MKIKTLNEAIEPVFEPFLFNSQEYADKQTGDGNLFYYEKDPEQIFIRLYKKGDQLISPSRAPFGGIEFSRGTALTTLFGFIKEIIEKAKSDGMKSIKIVAPPECYNISNADYIDETLIHAGFEVTVTELNYHLDTSEGSFENLIDPPEKRKITKCIEAGFECIEESDPDYRSIHQFIKNCRDRKGHPLSMNAEDFEKMFHDFPERYKLFVVKDKDTVVATAVGVKVHSEVLYNFLGADHPDYLQYSPTVLLNQVMYEYSRANGYKVYDLGIGTAGGIRNEGLISFKKNIGGILSHKYTYEIKLN